MNNNFQNYKEEIDKINILEATKLSMKRVINKFRIDNPNLIIDGNFSLNYKNEKSVIGGDKKSLSIATASIIAKVHRDRSVSYTHLTLPTSDLV